MPGAEDHAGVMALADKLIETGYADLGVTAIDGILSKLVPNAGDLVGQLNSVIEKLPAIEDSRVRVSSLRQDEEDVDLADLQEEHHKPVGLRAVK